MKAKKLILFAFFAGLSSSVHAQADKNVCDRSIGVRRILVGMVGKPCQHITPDDLRAIDNLDLGNLTGEIHGGDFDNLENVGYLTIEGNNQRHLDPDTFRGLKSLASLWLREGALEDVPETLFQYSPKLWYLILDNNRLRALPEKLFANTPLLQWFFVSNNDLSTFPEYLFVGTQLKWFQAYGNQIRTLPRNLFRTTPLETVELWSNQLTFIGDVFTGQAGLKVLKLDWNQIQTLDPIAFQGCASLEAPNLDHNRVIDLDDAVIRDLSPLHFKKLLIGDNPLTDATEAKLIQNLGARVKF